VKTLQEYKDAPPIDGFYFKCGQCGRLTTNCRGYVKTFDNYTEAEVGRLCHHCKSFQVGKTRFYKDGHILNQVGGGWVEFQNSWVYKMNFIYLKYREKIVALIKKLGFRKYS